MIDDDGDDHDCVNGCCGHENALLKCLLSVPLRMGIRMQIQTISMTAVTTTAITLIR